MAAQTKRSFLDYLRQYDAYPKTLEDFQVKTFSGAAVTVVAGVFMMLLFLSELNDYLSPQITEDLFVDTTRGSKLKINMDIVFPKIPCGLLSLDAMDLSGEQHINIQHNIYKRRLDLSGSPLDEPTRETVIGHGNHKSPDAKALLSNMSSLSNATHAVTEANSIPECGSCYGAEYGAVKCCRTCEDVKEAYRRRGWAIPPLRSIDQCVREGSVGDPLELPKEGCQVYGYLEVNRVGGSFHIAPGKSFQQSHRHVHDMQQYRATDFDLSHVVRHLSFGTNVLGKTNPLDGLDHRVEPGPRSIHYYIKIVPTLFQRKDGSTLSTNQFSVTQHDKKLNLLGFEEIGLPGIFFTYELSPMMVKYSEEGKSLGHFVTGVCAIMGGVFTVAGLIDAFIYHSYRAMQRKVQLGKAS